MKNNPQISPILAVALAVGLSACGGSDSLGYGKNAPDEFNVVKRPPLIMPPDYNLRPPGSGKAVALDSHQVARLLVLGETAAPVPTSAGEKSLLDKAADGLVYGDGIREKLVHEQRGTASLEAATTEQLVKDASETAQ